MSPRGNFVVLESSLYRMEVHCTGIWPYLRTEFKNQKNKGTLLSRTFKVGEKKVSLFFLIFGSYAEIWPESGTVNFHPVQ